MGDSCEALQIHCSCGWQIAVCSYGRLLWSMGDSCMADSYGAWEIAVWQIAMEHGR